MQKLYFCIFKIKNLHITTTSTGRGNNRNTKNSRSMMNHIFLYFDLFKETNKRK